MGLNKFLKLTVALHRRRALDNVNAIFDALEKESEIVINSEPEKRVVGLDNRLTVRELCKIAHTQAKEKGSHDEAVIDVPRSLMLIVSEVSEAMEADRKNLYAYSDLVQSMDVKDTPEVFEVFEACVKNTFEDELADVVIRVADLCGAMGINLEKHIRLKLAYNATREHKHGKRY
jgi:NTP pyrophosphatase (non-canonical NTP hydrolase)